MRSDEKIKLLSRAFQDVIWMAIRYAHGRHTYAPHMVRTAISDYQKVFPDWKPTKDLTITFNKRVNEELMAHPLDSLHDLVNKGVKPDVDTLLSPMDSLHDKNMKLILEIERLNKVIDQMHRHPLAYVDPNGKSL